MSYLCTVKIIIVMKRILFAVFAVLFCVLLMTKCVGYGSVIHSEFYVASYVPVSEFGLLNENYRVYPDSVVPAITLRYDVLTDDDRRCCYYDFHLKEFVKDQVQLEKFYKLAEKHGEFKSKGRTFGILKHPAMEHQAILSDICKISIVSDSVWDENHAAGESLDDVFALKWNSPYEFIKNGYEEPAVRRYDKRLSEMTTTDYYLMQPKFWLYPLSNPMVSGVFPFTITINTDDGEEYVVHCEKEF